MNNKQRALNLIGMAQRAGQLTSGESLVLKAIRSGQAKLVVLASDASDNARKQFLNKCEYYDVVIDTSFSREEISHALGKERTVCALLDKGFVHSLQKLL
ncbi:YlxQ-related RNA-binding protein [Alkalibacterium sp.]|nr:MAG: YlxQ-related RNA-binding protein [Alkalibacterium sp.]